jgi:hypothetical protein
MNDAQDLIGDAMRTLASRHGLVFREYKDWDGLVQEIVAIDGGGDQYTFYAYSPHPNPSFGAGSVVVGATLRKRGAVRHHALQRERARFTYQKTVSLADVENVLDEALTKVLEWVREAGHDASTGLPGAT